MTLAIVIACSASFFVVGYLVGYKRCKKIMRKIYRRMSDEEVEKCRKWVFGE